MDCNVYLKIIYDKYFIKTKGGLFITFANMIFLFVK